jgi:5-(carboxyamino)imidazole ribonucleotide synthase
MFNLIGRVPPAGDVLRFPNASLHDYGKEPRPNRKVGHVTLRASTTDGLSEKLPEWSRAFERQPGA